MKKLIRSLRVTLLSLALLSTFLASAHDVEVDGIYYKKLSDTEVAVSYCGNSSSYSNEYTGDVTIPSRITYTTTEYSVTSIGSSAFRDCTMLTSVTIPNSVTTIGEFAFYRCSGLASVTIPNSVTSIGNHAFYNCGALTFILIPISVTSIGDHALGNCNNLEEINVEKGNQNFCSENGVLFNYDKTVLVCCPGAKSEYVIPNSITSIGNTAFIGCNALTSISIPNSVTSIGNSAFSNCRALTSISIPNSVTSIGSYAFENCDALTSVKLPNSLTTIENGTFAFCDALRSVIIPSSVTKIGINVFRPCPKLEAIIVEDGNQNFCSENGVLFSKDKTVLVCCPGSKSEYVIPNTVTTIRENAFASCTALKSVIMSNSVTSIGEGAFISCSGLSTIVFSNSVNFIDGAAFAACSNIKNIYYLTEDPILAPSVFSSVFSTAILHVPASALEKFKSTEPWNRFENIDTSYSEMMSPIFNEAMGDVITIGPNSKSELAPALHGFGPAKGVQFDLTLPKGLSLTDVTAAGADSELSGLTASHAKLENGDFRVLIYTNDGAELGNLMLGMSFESDGTLERGEILCHNIIHSIFDTEVTLDDETALVTGYDVNMAALILEELESYTLSTPVSTTIENVTYRWGEIEPANVAELSAEGVITAKNPGEAVYSLYVKDGDRPEKKYTALLEVAASLWGDADKDGSVNISDLVAVVNYILERSPESFNTRLADIDHNGRINIVDLTGIVKIILSQQQAEEATAYSTFSARQELAFGEVETLSDNSHRIALEIQPSDGYTAMQTDIRLPEGVKLENLTIGNGLDGHTVDYAEVGVSTVRVIIYSPSLAGLTAGKKAAVAELVLSGELTEDAVISAGETLACDTDGYAYTLASTEKTMGNTTSIVSVKAGECKAIAVQGGIELNAPEATAVRISDLSGRRVAETVTPATVSLAAGVYLVTFENIATLKVIVK